MGKLPFPAEPIEGAGSSRALSSPSGSNLRALAVAAGKDGPCQSKVPALANSSHGLSATPLCKVSSPASVPQQGAGTTPTKTAAVSPASSQAPCLLQGPDGKYRIVRQTTTAPPGPETVGTPTKRRRILGKTPSDTLQPQSLEQSFTAAASPEAEAEAPDHSQSTLLTAALDSPTKNDPTETNNLEEGEAELPAQVAEEVPQSIDPPTDGLEEDLGAELEREMELLDGAAAAEAEAEAEEE